MSKTDTSRQDAQFPPQYYPAYPYPSDDEVSLLDLGKVLYRRIRLVIATTLFCILFASVFLLVTPSNYTFQTVVEIGTYPDAEGQLQLIEPESALISRVRSSSLPSALRTLSQQVGLSIDYLPEVELTENSGMLVLSSQIRSDQQTQERAGQLHQLTVDNLLNVHQSMMKTQQEEYEIARRTLQLDLESLESRAQLNTQLAILHVSKSVADAKLEQLTNDELRLVELRRLERNLSSAQSVLQSLLEQELNLRELISRQPDKERLLLRQMERAEGDLNELRTSRQQVVNTWGTGEPQLSQTLLLIDSQINNALKVVRDLENSLYLKLPEESDELRRSLVELVSEIGVQERRVAEAQQALKEFEISRDLMVQQAQSELDRIEAESKQLLQGHDTSVSKVLTKLDSVNNQMNRLNNSRVVVEPGLDRQSRGLSSSMIIVLAALLGLILGLIVAFATEFGVRLKDSIAQESEGKRAL